MALALLSGAAGCTLTGEKLTSPLRTEGAPVFADAGTDARPMRDLPRRPPKAKTCIEYGKFREDEARAPGRTQAEQQALLDQARKMYQLALQQEPKNPQAGQALARLYARQGDHERAVAAYQKAIKYHPKEVSLYGELGMCHARQKEWEPALKALRKAHDLDPENRQSAHNLGFCLARAGRFDESLALLQKTDGEAKAHYNLARMLHHMQQDDLSRQHVQAALQKDPHLVPAHQLLAQLNGSPTPVQQAQYVPPPTPNVPPPVPQGNIGPTQPAPPRSPAPRPPVNPTRRSPYQ
jgi:tetratricopeptide (TPR) repeat protein